MLKIKKSKKRSDYSWVEVPMGRLITTNLSALARGLGISRQGIHLWKQKNGFIYVPIRHQEKIKEFLK